MKKSLFALCMLLHFAASAQGYTSFFTGDTTDALAIASGGTCMMGGATEDDNAMRWFLERSGGGDILVLRASGSNGYNAYLYSQLGVTVNSVETIRFDNATAATDPYVQRRVAEAEAIWFAGGDQWDYISYWRGTAIDSIVNEGLQQRHLVIGGTSAGMAILGGYYFSAVNGTVTSATAMTNPYNNAVTPDSTSFLQVDYLADVITDTHYENPDRRGRQVAFLARIFTDYGVAAHGIACDEYTAVCIDTNGIAQVYGDAPNSEDNAYFIQVNCEVPGNQPEVCVPGLPLQWDQNGMAIKVYHVQGTPSGGQTFDLNDWKTGVGGNWEDWSVYNLALFSNPGTAINCGPVAVAMRTDDDLQIFPNPVRHARLQVCLSSAMITLVTVRNALGQVVLRRDGSAAHCQTLELDGLAPGAYWLQALSETGASGHAFLVE